MASDIGSIFISLEYKYYSKLVQNEYNKTR